MSDGSAESVNPRCHRRSATRTVSTGYLDLPRSARYAGASSRAPLLITLNGEPYELDRPLTVADLLARLAIDARRVAVEHNLTILKRGTFADALVREGDRVEIVNFVGGG